VAPAAAVPAGDTSLRPRQCKARAS
jgi:hypothetical protein